MFTTIAFDRLTLDCRLLKQFDMFFAPLTVGSISYRAAPGVYKTIQNVDKNSKACSHVHQCKYGWIFDATSTCDVSSNFFYSNWFQLKMISFNFMT